MRKRNLVHGIGVNDVEGSTTSLIGGKHIMCQYYCRWKAMLRRVTTLENYKDCSVCEEWLTFSNFKAWMEKQDWEGKYLDKDLKEGSSKIYSPETCMFIPQYINSVVRDFNNVNGKGICPDRSGKYKVFTYVDSKQYYLGIYSDLKEAQLTWVRGKKEIVMKDILNKGYGKYKNLLENYFNNEEERINGSR